jgi:putative iron-regulated protein
LLKAAVARHYATLVRATYGDAVKAAEDLRAAVGAFLDAPSHDSLATARAAWIVARKPYSQSEAFRFYEGPIERVEGRINGWPVDESYLDVVEGDPSAGIINNPELHPVLSKESIAALNERDGEKSICTGYHAIEFLLWGQDFDPNGPGKRSFRDYITGPESTAPHPERRREYLRLVTDLLVDDLRSVADEWEAGRPANYRVWFEASAPHQSIRKILHGIAALGGTELAGERLTVAYETKEQEDEHSCFSDTTGTDVMHNALGIRNAFTGQYVRLDGSHLEGPGIADLLRESDPALADELGSRIDASLASARSILAPFDQAFLGTDNAPGRMAIHRTIGLLQQQTETMAKAASLLGVRDEIE